MSRWRCGTFRKTRAGSHTRTGPRALLADLFLRSAAQKMNREGLRLTKANVLQLQGYDWPGNVRELQNVVERSVILAREGRLRFDLKEAETVSEPDAETLAQQGSPDIVPDAVMRHRERANILAALQRTEWKISGSGGAAELLGLKPTTLAYRVKNFGLKRPG